MGPHVSQARIVPIGVMGPRPEGAQWVPSPTGPHVNRLSLSQDVFIWIYIYVYIYICVYIYGYQVPDTRSCQVPDRARYQIVPGTRLVPQKTCVGPGANRPSGRWAKQPMDYGPKWTQRGPKGTAPIASQL
jgi:hypothetical protein